MCIYMYGIDSVIILSSCKLDHMSSKYNNGSHNQHQGQWYVILIHIIILLLTTILMESSILKHSTANFLLARALYMKSVSCQEQNNHKGNDFIMTLYG